MADSHTADLAALEAELADLERQLKEPARLEQAQAAVLRSLEREERELELAANNTARRFEELARAEQNHRRADSKKRDRWFGLSGLKSAKPTALETAVAHHRSAADIARTREQAQRAKVQTLRQQCVEIERQLDEARKQDEQALRCLRDRVRADLAERTDNALSRNLRENELSLMAERREREDWVAELDFER